MVLCIEIGVRAQSCRHKGMAGLCGEVMEMYSSESRVEVQALEEGNQA